MHQFYNILFLDTISDALKWWLDIIKKLHFRVFKELYSAQILDDFNKMLKNGCDMQIN